MNDCYTKLLASFCCDFVRFIAVAIEKALVDHSFVTRLHVVGNTEHLDTFYITLLHTGIWPHIGIREDCVHMHVTCKH